MKTFRPMLAGTVDDISTLGPGLVSPKIDGIRCIIKDGKALSRKLKPIPNLYIRQILESSPELDGCDGELIISGNFNDVQSAVMSEDGEPDFIFYIFDKIMTAPYKDRYAEISKIADSRHVKVLKHTSVQNLEDVLIAEKEALAQGFEGLMFRKEDGPYKFGRSTAKEKYLIKIKKFLDSEAIIVGFEEQMQNNNEKETNELGLTKRSTKKENKTGKNTLGAFVVDFNGHIFNIGTGEGLTHELRKEYWENQESLKGKLVKFKYFETSKDGIPRFPIFLGFRDERDL